jgi:hypothetical protein
LGYLIHTPQFTGSALFSFAQNLGEAGGSFLLFAISSSLSQWLSPASAGLRDKF